MRWMDSPPAAGICALALVVTATLNPVASAGTPEPLPWHTVIELDSTAQAPSVRTPVVFRSSRIESPIVAFTDSPDIPVTTASNTTQSENSVFVSPTNPLLLLNSNNSSNWPVSTIYGASYWISTDGGLTWTGSTGGAGGTNKGDPATAISRDGRMFVGYIAPDCGQGVAYSDNNGASWTPRTVAAGFCCPFPQTCVLDKNHLWVDNSTASPYVGNIYSSWTKLQEGQPDYGQIEFMRSTDGGVNWTSRQTLSTAVAAGSHNQGVNVQTGPNGEVYVVWAIYDCWPCDESALGFAKSTNGGQSFSASQRIRSGIRGHRNTALGGAKTMRHNSYPSMTVNQQTGQISVVWTNIGVPGVNTGDPDIYLIQSSDGGTSWSSPRRVNRDPIGNGKDNYFPWIACDPATGLLACIYYDSRNFAGNDMVETFVAISSDQGATWGDFRVSDVGWSGDGISGFGGNYAGDYVGIVVRQNRVFPMWSDNRTGNMLAYVSPFTPPMTVTYPNGGETLVVLCDATITWTSTGGSPTVDIEYSYNGGTNWIPIATGTPNDGSHVWSVPGFTSTQALVRITAGSETDVSDAFFTIAAVPPTVTYPNGGEILTAGGTANITWTAPACLSTVSLAYSTTGNPPWWSIASQTPNDGSYSWTIPATPTTQARVQVYAGAAIDPSNGPFTIQGVGVTYPNGGEYLPSGTVATITWASVNAGATANIDYSTDGGGTWASIVSGTPNDGAHDWTVPAIATTQGRVRVTSGAYSDISNFNFNIVVPPTAWVPDGVMLKFKTADAIQYPTTVTDGAGGAFVCWKRTWGANLGVYVNRVTGAGAMPSPWPFGGKKIASTDGAVWQPHHTVADGSGGLYAGFNTSGNAVVQHATSNGDVQTGWPVDGVVLGPGIRTRVSPDGSGGVYAAWIGSGGVRIQRLTSSGALASGWPAGGVLLVSGTFYSMDVVGNGTSGAYVAGDGFVHRMTSSGVKDPAWPASGLAIPSCYRVRIVGDGAGGAVVSYSNGPFNQTYTLKATRVMSDATFFPGWSSAGVTISTEAEQFHYYDYHNMATDGTGGALLAFSTTGSQAIKAHRVNGTGALAVGWPAGGAVLSGYYYSLKASPTVINDGAGGCVATWQELRNFTGCEGQPNLEGCDWDIFSGHVSHSGIVDPTFATDGTVISA